MDIAAEWLLHAGEALLKAALNPFSCLAWFLLALICRRRTELERKLFAVRLHSMPGEWLRAFGAGLAGALAVSLAAALFGLNLTADAVYWTWGIVLVLLMFRLRFANLPTAAALIGVLQPAVRPLRDLLPGEVKPLADSLISIDLASLWMLSAMTLVVQAVLVRLSASRSALPLYVGGKRGKAIGAYQLHGLWLMPFMLTVPAPGAAGTAAGAAAAGAGGGAAYGAAAGSAAAAASGLSGWQTWFLAMPDGGTGAATGGLAAWLPWPMFFGDGAWTGGIALLAFPALAGFVDFTISDLPHRRATRLAWRYAAWGVAAGAAAVAVRFLPAALPAAAAVVLLLPEVWQQLADRAERRKSPEFVHKGRGLKVLDVLVPGPAAEMGIARGDTVVRANGWPVDTTDKLHAALRSNPAFSRLEVVDMNGENRFVQRPLYSGEHHLLGLVLCPDDRVLETAYWRPLTLWQLFRIRTQKHRPPEDAFWRGPAGSRPDGEGSGDAAGSAGEGDPEPKPADEAAVAKEDE